MRFPKEIYVYEYDREGKTPLLELTVGIDGIPQDLDGADVGIYRLVEVKRLDIDYHLAPKPAKKSRR